MKTNEGPAASEPYRFFFFSGWIISVLGVGIWLVYQLNGLNFYPLSNHANLMVAGFLSSYVFGFLMTAVPKMSQTQSASKGEVYTGLVLVWLQVFINFLWSDRLSFALAAVQFLFIITFILRRLKSKQATPPSGFIFVLIGLLIGLSGTVILALPPEWTGSQVIHLGKSFLYQAFILNLILGLGSRLIPMLSRVEGAVDIRTAMAESKWNFVLLAILLNGAFFVEAFLSSSIGYFLIFAVIAFVAVKKFKVFNKRNVSGNLGTGIRAAVFMLAAGFLLAGVFPQYAIHFLHITFIGGFSMLTILISTRVVLAHGQYNLTAELMDRHLIWFVFVFLILALGRAASGFYPSERQMFHLILFLGWSAGCLIWGKSYLRKLLRANAG